MSPPEGALKRLRDRRLLMASAGVAATAIFYAVGSTTFGAGEQTLTIQGSGCTTQMIAPKRVVAGEQMRARLSRTCPGASEGTVVLRAGENTFAWFVVDGKEVDVFRKILNDHDLRSQEEIVVTKLSSSTDTFRFALAMDGQTRELNVGHNILGELPGFLRGLLVVAGAIPALMGLVLGFFADIRRAVDRVLNFRNVESKTSTETAAARKD